jgi:5-methyltetrahydrofolate corrinoid/iron sulfur protein methyltransferase
LIDTANPVAMRAGLEANRKIAVINGISLEPQKLDEILPLAVQYDVDVIGYLLDGRSQMPSDQDDRMAIALELFQHCLSAGLRTEQLIIDPVVAPLIWQDGLRRNRDLLQIVRRLPELLDFPVRTVAGLSNLTTGQGPRNLKRRIEQLYLSMLAAAGLSWVLLDIHHHDTVASVRICQTLLNDDIFAWDPTVNDRASAQEIRSAQSVSSSCWMATAAASNSRLTAWVNSAAVRNRSAAAISPMASILPAHSM